MKIDQFMKQMGTLQVEAYNEALNDVVKTIQYLDEHLDKNQRLTVNQLIEVIQGLKIN